MTKKIIKISIFVLLLCGSFSVSQLTYAKTVAAPTVMRWPISFTKSSELKPYPKNISKTKDRIIVSLKKQRAYLKRDKKTRYEFYVSTGAHHSTPRGHYRINYYRAPWFYSVSEKMGARYAVGFLQGGLYLFHENPRNYHKRTIKAVARKLGKQPSSHGCVHLSTSDAKWFYHKAPVGLRVIIK